MLRCREVTFREKIRFWAVVRHCTVEPLSSLRRFWTGSVFFWFKFKHTLSLPKHTLFSHTKSWFLVPISCPAGFCSFSCVSGGAVLHNPGHRFAVTVAAKLTVAILLAAAVPPPATRIAPNFARPAVDRRIRHHR